MCLSRRTQCALRSARMACVYSSLAVRAPHEMAARPAYEEPPEIASKAFEVLFPIMARLPVARSQETFQTDELDVSSGYLQPRADLAMPGTMPFSPRHRGVTYTASRLPRLDDAARELWKALHCLRPLTADYMGDFGRPTSQRRGAALAAECPFASAQSPSTRTALDLVRTAFDWPAIVLPRAVSGTFYGVVFRSKRAAGSESTELYAADRLAHEEAVGSGGLLMYFYGAPDPRSGTNMATCIWTSRAEALVASALPLHARAATHARKAYEAFELSRYRLRKVAGEATLRIEAWKDEEEG